MLWKKVGGSIAVLCAVLVAGNAQALTIGGEEYDKILTITTGGGQDFGYWPGPDKYYTFQSNDNYIKPLNVGRVSFRDPVLNGVNIGKVFAMGTTAEDLGPVNSGQVTLSTSSNQLLLDAQLIPDGTLEAIYKSGSAGQLNVNGLYNVIGGSLFTGGLISGPLYIEIAFDYVWQNKYADLKTTFGTFNFYRRSGGEPPPNPVPEPGSMALLGTSLIGLIQSRRR